MVCVLGALLFLYLSAGLSLLSSRNEIAQNRAQVERLEREHTKLVRERRRLLSPAHEQEQARELGMEWPGEHVYEVRGLPSN
jgi:cell division protein FtsB